MTSRVLTVTDDASAVEARIVVERTDSGPPRIVDVRLRTTDGHGLRAEDLLVLEEMGLRLPDPAPADGPTPEPVAEPDSPLPRVPPAEKKPGPGRSGAGAAAARTAVKKRATKPARQYRRRPPSEELLGVYHQCGGSPSAIATHYGVPRYTVVGWMDRARSGGVEFGRASSGGETGPAVAVFQAPQVHKKEEAVSGGTS